MWKGIKIHLSIVSSKKNDKVHTLSFYRKHINLKLKKIKVKLIVFSKGHFVNLLGSSDMFIILI